MTTTTSTRKTWAPQFPVLAYATTPRCNAKASRAANGAGLACVKPAGHEGRHLIDIAAADLKTAEQVAAEAAEAEARWAAAMAALEG